MSSSGLPTTGKNPERPKLGIIGGSGMCSFPELTIVSRQRPETKYGLPSDEILIGEHAGQLVAFLPRHGSEHTIAPHKVPYKANLAALKSVGVEYVVGTCIAGSLKREIVPSSFVLLDQFVNLTWGRDDYTEADDGAFVHLPMGEPYCPHVGRLILESAALVKIPMIPKGTAAVIQGPRFSTKAESRDFSARGWDVVNMTQYPECYFARELGLCYAAFAAVTDYDVGLEESLVIDPYHMDAVLHIFKDNTQKTKEILLAFIVSANQRLNCACASVISKPYYEQG